MTTNEWDNRAKTAGIPAEEAARIVPVLTALETAFAPLITRLAPDTNTAVTFSPAKAEDRS
jgi:hypothetical protein